jgi:hypothetical protein
MTTLGMPNKLMNMLSTLPRISSTDLNPELMEAHLKTFFSRVNATLWLQFRIAHQTASSDHSCPSGSRQDPKEAEGRKERREMIFDSRRAMASPILKDRVCFLLSTSKPVMVGELLSCFSELHPILTIILRSIGIGQRAKKP